MYSKDDLDLSKIRHTYTSTNISDNDSVLVFNGNEDFISLNGRNRPDKQNT
jgi:hypothetical protein